MSKISLSEFKSSLLEPLPPAPESHVLELFFSFPVNVLPHEIWPYVSDTSRLNKELGFGARTEKEEGGETIVNAYTMKVEEEWVEKPWVWQENRELQYRRIYRKGWMLDHHGIFTVSPAPEGALVNIYFRWCFDALWKKLLFRVLGNFITKRWEEVLKSKEQVIIAQRNQLVPENAMPAQNKSAAEAVLDYLKTADDLDLQRLHVKQLAKVLHYNVDDIIGVCKDLVGQGALILSWDVICPHCRGVRVEYNELSGLEDMSSCESCDVEFGLEEEESVELVFHVTPKLRTVPKVTFCAAEPAKKKHMKLHQRVAPGQERKFNLELLPGRYRLRAKGFEKTAYINVDGRGSQEVMWSGETREDFSVGNSFRLSFKNPTEKETFVTVEEAWWFSDRLLPGEALSHPVMRTLFSEDHLKTGIRLNVGKQVILFTDIVGSTPLYKNSGDARAFREVQKHFQEVREIIEKHKGTVIKFIGDATMAAYLNIHDAFLSALELHQKFSANRADSPIRLRVSLHEGMVICANLNVGLDYFGNTVNQSAKLQKWAGAHEIALTREDWTKLEPHFKQMNITQSVHDEKLGVDVKVIAVS